MTETIKWVDGRSNKRKVIRLDVLGPDSEVVGQVQHLFDPKDRSTLGEERKSFLRQIIYEDHLRGGVC